jgi:RHS repeat-associated protein
VLEKYVYDGWNVVLVLDDENVTQRKYTWGLDLSGTIHGAGGIGGLLVAMHTQGTTVTTDDQKYWFFYDANGNVGQVVDGTDLNNITIAAKYEYDPYGNLIASSGPYKDANPFRFSTKWFDNETGLGYWGKRYYDPRTGRWTSHDPIAEAGGLNLYTAMANSPVSWFDPDGAAATTQPTSQPSTQPVIDRPDKGSPISPRVVKRKSSRGESFFVRSNA